ncbi:uncharacterized protein LOC129957148 [Argiope bruennichi]|uniref:uncharacterized protein LOC129957148 n=1 Tax=Argiope bruennichi TaxID=94029 RepID=UPI002495A461|nr:uncharacterized protein LOC129957148 [Argiope bruennichi]
MGDLKMDWTMTENQLMLGPKLSLGEMALRMVLSNSWHDFDILTSLQSIQFRSIYDGKFEDVCQPFVDQIKEKVYGLGLPESLKQKTTHLFKPLLLDILEWKVFHERFFFNSGGHFDVSILEQMCWTSVGSVDYQKTAEKLARVETLDVVKRYELTCLYCLLDYIPILWEELPDEVKRAETARFPTLGRDTSLEYYWAQCVKGKDADISPTYLKEISFLKNAFEFAACTGNVTATTYFFHKLPVEKRDPFLYRTVHFVIAERDGNPFSKRFHFPKKKCSEVLRYLLYLMRPDHRNQVLRERPAAVLTCFLDWPLQDYFLDVADFIFGFLPVGLYSDVESCISKRINATGYYCPDLIQSLFLRCPVRFREEIVCDFDFFRFIIRNDDTETLQVILRNIDLGSRPLNSAHWFVELLRRLSEWEKLDLVELCIREKALSKKRLKEVKEALKKFHPDNTSREDTLFFTAEQIRRLDLEWRRFFDLLDKLEASVPGK